ncbi:MAG: c-type cytochrome [Alphaproteobacteria bacterium]
MKLTSWIALTTLAVAVIGVGAILLSTSDPVESPAAEDIAAGQAAPLASASAASVLIPAQLSPTAELGRVAFTDNCAGCHGTDGSGTDRGPPLIHIIYEPSHHSDTAFILAARNGSRAHHWRFGDMPPQPQVSEDEIGTIIQFVREIQRANGIF